MKKKRNWSKLKEGIILYLAISKILYWINTVGEMSQGNLGNAWPVIINRILNQDLPLILVIITLVLIDMSKGKHYLKLFIGYLGYLVVLFLYTLIVQQIFQGSWGLGFAVFGSLFWEFTLQFVIISVVLSLKEYFTGKVKEKPEKDT